MSRVCAVLNCKISPYERKRFFKFPVNQESAKKWAKACHREDLLKKINRVCQPYSPYFVCETHFEDGMFHSKRRCRLRSHAIPTVFLDEDMLNSLEISVKEESLIDPLKSEIEEPASPPFVSCESNDESYNGTMEFLPEQPINCPFSEMACSPIYISDDEGTFTSEEKRESSPNFSVDHIQNSMDCFPKAVAEVPVADQIWTPQCTKNLRVDLSNSIMECRTCLISLRSAKMAPLYEKCHPVMTIKEMISFCVPLMASNLSDGDFICRNCLRTVRLCVKFIEDCLAVENTLRDRHQSREVEFVEVPTIKAEDEDALSETHDRPTSTSSGHRTESNPSDDFVFQKTIRVNPNVDTFRCNLCAKNYRTRYMLEDHLRKVHNIERDGGYSCQMCRLHFVKLKDFEKHWMSHTAYCSVCKKRNDEDRESLKSVKMFMEDQICEHIEYKNSSKKLSCQEQDMIIDSEDDLNKRSTEEVLYNCYKCARVIKGESKYVSHIKSHGHPNKLFFCDKCTKSYGKYKVLRYHQMISHYREKISCKFCSRMIWNFNMPSHHRSHHLAQLTHVCKICDDTFDSDTDYKSHLREHIAMGHVSTKKHQSPSKSKDKSAAWENKTEKTTPVRCNICFLRFSSAQDLSEHMSTHQSSDPSGIDYPQPSVE